MIRPGDTPAPCAAELHAALERTLSCYFGAPRRIASLTRRPSAYRSSFNLEELDVCLDDGTTLPLVFKDISRQALLAEAREAKPTFLYDPRREIETYRTILSSGHFSTATCYGTVVDPGRERYWLFLERVTGVELGQVGDIAVWQQVAKWLADLHTYFGSEGKSLGQSATQRLLRYDRDFYRLWLRRAQVFFSQTDSSLQRSVETVEGFARLVESYDRVVEPLVALPSTLLHGEFYPSNVLVQQADGPLRICPVDWEMTARGPGLLDLAALTAGKWSEAERAALASAYYAAFTASEGWQPTPEEFLVALDYCRLHVAIQWLGWSRVWSPPTEHARDWLGEALRLAEKLGL